MPNLNRSLLPLSAILGLITLILRLQSPHLAMFLGPVAILTLAAYRFRSIALRSETLARNHRLFLIIGAGLESLLLLGLLLRMHQLPGGDLLTSVGIYTMALWMLVKTPSTHSLKFSGVFAGVAFAVTLVAFHHVINHWPAYEHYALVGVLTAAIAFFVDYSKFQNILYPLPFKLMLALGACILFYTQQASTFWHALLYRTTDPTALQRIGGYYHLKNHPGDNPEKFLKLSEWFLRYQMGTFQGQTERQAAVYNAAARQHARFAQDSADLRQALHWSDSALALKGTARHHATRCKILYKLGQNRAAFEAAEKAVALIRENEKQRAKDQVIFQVVYGVARYDSESSHAQKAYQWQENILSGGSFPDLILARGILKVKAGEADQAQGHFDRAFKRANEIGYKLSIPMDTIEKYQNMAK